MGGSRGFFFFFQAEDGIRDGHVTGVQTCALPISLSILVSSALATAQTVMEGAVQDLSGNPIHDAKVVLQHTNGVPAQISNTNSNGRFQFAAVDAGAYQIKTDASGFYPALYELTVRPRQ